MHDFHDEVLEDLKVVPVRDKLVRDLVPPVSMKLLLDHKEAEAKVNKIANKRIRGAAKKHFGFNPENS